ncbi:MAG: hypothetical protein KC731_28515 [Myxococcales bacterium]|nr:hypothetical protein [Myxococcales bacterium]
MTGRIESSALGLIDRATSRAAEAAGAIARTASRFGDATEVSIRGEGGGGDLVGATVDLRLARYGVAMGATLVRTGAELDETLLDMVR